MQKMGIPEYLKQKNLVISNIRKMQAKIQGTIPENINTFMLKGKTLFELRELQDILIPVYNKACIQKQYDRFFKI
jgi:hypothetical protein